MTAIAMGETPKPQFPAIKLRFRQQEIIFISGIFLFVVLRHLWNAFTISDASIQAVYLPVYATDHLSFNYTVNVLLPNIGCMLLVYGLYMLTNRVVTPIKRADLSKGTLYLMKRVGAIVVPLVTGAFVVALGVATGTEYAHPWLFNYGGFKILSIFGYIPNLMTVFGNALFLTAIYAAYVYVLQSIIAFIETPDNRNGYRIMVANKVTTLFFIYLFALLLLNEYQVVYETDVAKNVSALVVPVLLVCFCNIYWLFPRTEEASSIFKIQFLVPLLLTTFVFSLPFRFFQPAQWHPWLYMLVWLFNMAIVTPLSWLYYRQKKDTIIQLRQMQKALTRSETDIRFLRSQINPHFLFNTLNTLYGLALQENSSRTAEGIQKLGDMMRFMLHENHRDVIPVAHEIAYLRNYIDLQKLRIHASPDIVIETNIADNGCTHFVAPMLLIPLVENAFKHGISLKEPSWIKIHLYCDEKSISMEVRNSIHPHQQNKDVSGIGIKNVTERLKQLYPKRHQLYLNGHDKEFHTRLSIQF